jgi:C1A family cysteine protease
MTHALGRRVNHDPRSLAHPAATTAEHRPVSHRTYGPVLDQGNLGSCVGNAAAHALNTKPVHRLRTRLCNEGDAVGFYSGATQLDGYPGSYPPEDTGTDANSVAKFLRNGGHITSWQHCFGLDHVLAALQLAPVLLGISWHQSMFTPDSKGFVHPDGNVVGGHETLIRADDATRSVLVRNSWGIGWGLRGHYRLTYADLSALLVDSGDATVLTA